MLYATLCFAAVATTAAFQTPVAPLHLAKPAVSRVADGEPPCATTAAPPHRQIPTHSPRTPRAAFSVHAMQHERAMASGG